MDRRRFIQSSALAGLSGALPRIGSAAQPAFNPSPSAGWRTFEVTTVVTPVTRGEVATVWIPLPSIDNPDWIRPLASDWQGNAARAGIAEDTVYGAKMLVAQWRAGQEAPVIELVNRFATRDRAIDFSQPGAVAPLDAPSHKLYTQATELLPTDGIVRDTALKITRGAGSDMERARAVYEWICDNTERNPKTRGCGLGDIRSMLESGNLSGKCADLNALFVGLARAAGLPARDVYGVRVADSKFGYKSLGKAGDITKAQHCRAEVWLAGFGWVPVDPADVRKVVLEERPGLTLKDDVVVAARKALFGSWEMNWLAYNVAHDLKLPESTGPAIPFLMYPQAETSAGRADSLDAANFVYTITSKEVTA
ncbi:transglutaminase-like domain-containing protein [Methyloversatilis sp.]|uniref:transglutaminase-like domain-containing protein n=1 Tax=Methyloversatilis sp. TaxID=2569862 RepID=UPI0027336080|nr:transglutaminase-like domain-containing protein [Methyloversatilis sp.]MDP2870845.1 transglutaminase-like domain-containing protein [Methyloversatilis sp.]MDP3456178.1 transglutaminase-like domain-containing protein [Methyloversatilis sp.]MDP3577130.1 transglutaminase-like domain-containing protein [Methyloversatilis sp.]